MAFENLAVRVSAQTADATSGLRAVRRATSSAGSEATEAGFKFGRFGEALDEVASDAAAATLALGAFGSRANDAGDDAAVAGLKAGGASAGFSSFAITTSGASLAVGTFSTTVTTALIPALAAASTLLAPLTAGLTALAAFGGGTLLGLGTVVGTGAVAGLTRLQTALSETVAELRTIATEVGEPFVDLLLAAVRAAPDLARGVLRAAGSLEPFANFLGFLGRTAQDVIPGIARVLFDLGREALGPLRGIITTLRREGPAAFRALLGAARSLAPEFSRFLGALGRIDGLILSTGTALANRLLPALTGLINATVEFANSEQFAATLRAFREAVGREGFQRTLREFGRNISRIFTALARNGPEIARGVVAVTDSILDIINAVTPAITAFIDLLGAAGRLYAQFTANSEQVAARQERTRIESRRGVNPVNRRLQRGGGETAERLGASPGLVEAVRQAIEAADIDISLDGRRVNEQLNQSEERYTGYRRGSE